MKITDLKEDEAIHCATKAEAVRICKMMHELGLKWKSGRSYLDRTCWNAYEDRTCYYPAEGSFALELTRPKPYHSELFQEEPESTIPCGEITVDGLLSRGFLVSGLGGHYLESGEWAVHVTDSGVELGIDSNWITTNCQNLTDIDHLIRLLGV